MATNSIGDSHASLLCFGVAAAVLGINDVALRPRIPRQAIGTRVNAADQLFVRMHYDLTDYVRAGMTASEVREDDIIENLDKPSPRRVLNPWYTRPPRPPNILPRTKRTPLNEARITDLKQVCADQIADLKAVIVELANRHGAEVDRMIKTTRLRCNGLPICITTTRRACRNRSNAPPN